MQTDGRILNSFFRLSSFAFLLFFMPLHSSSLVRADSVDCENAVRRVSQTTDWVKKLPFDLGVAHLYDNFYILISKNAGIVTFEHSRIPHSTEFKIHPGLAGKLSSGFNPWISVYEITGIESKKSEIENWIRNAADSSSLNRLTQFFGSGLRSVYDEVKSEDRPSMKIFNRTRGLKTLGILALATSVLSAPLMPLPLFHNGFGDPISAVDYFFLENSRDQEWITRVMPYLPQIFELEKQNHPQLDYKKWILDLNQNPEKRKAVRAIALQIKSIGPDRQIIWKNSDSK